MNSFMGRQGCMDRGVGMEWNGMERLSIQSRFTRRGIDIIVYLPALSGPVRGVCMCLFHTFTYSFNHSLGAVTARAKIQHERERETTCYEGHWISIQLYSTYFSAPLFHQSQSLSLFSC